MANAANYFFIFIIGILVRGNLARLEDALQSDFKFQVSLRSGLYGTHVCGGSIITQKWVVTTAACSDKIKQNPYVFIGTNQLQDVSPRAKLVRINRIIKHEGFTQNLENNIAVMETAETMDYSDSVLNVRLPIYGEALPESATLCGWPFPDSSNPNANRNLKVINNLQLVKQNCQTVTGIPVTLNNGEFCGFDQSTDSKSCLADLGGALIKDQILHGLLSRTDCIMQPEILIQISSYSNWIKSSLGDDANDIKWDNTYPGTGGGGGGGGAASLTQSSIFVFALLSCLYYLNRF